MDNASVPNDVRNQKIEQYVAQYGACLLRTCYMLLSDRAQAEDALQDTFLRAWKAMDAFEGRNGASEKTWLVRIAVNVCKDYKRSAWFRHTDRSKTPEDMHDHANAASPDTPLTDTIIALPEPYKKAILLYYYNGMTLKETADTLHKSLSGTSRILKKACGMLKISLEQEGAE